MKEKYTPKQKSKHIRNSVNVFLEKMHHMLLKPMTGFANCFIGQVYTEAFADV